MNLENFLKISLKNWKIVGALMPTFDWVADAIVRRIDPSSKYIIEYGPGNGIITRKLLQNLRPDGRVLSIELVEDFARELGKIKDPRLTVIHDDVLVVSRKLRDLIPRNDGELNFADVVLSGIPFTYIPKKDRHTIVKNTYESLREGGIFLVYQNSSLLLPILKRYFKKVDWFFEPRNIPPYFIMVAKK